MNDAREKAIRNNRAILSGFARGKQMLTRDITCWYCQHGRHTDCFSKQLCACRVCLEPHTQETN